MKKKVILGSGAVLLAVSLAVVFPLLKRSGKENGPAAIPLKFEAIGNWEYLEGKTPIPESVMKYDGKYVEMVGFLMPWSDPEEATEFMLVQGIWGCCFGAPPNVNQIVIVETKTPIKMEKFFEAVRVKGVFSAKETLDQGFLVSLFKLQADKVQKDPGLEATLHQNQPDPPPEEPGDMTQP